jgi:N-acetyl-gamma-glutamyl-phosphate/LysW-gamma-L-alpha-aminoadipyl-6-phosphate reductase
MIRAAVVGASGYIGGELLRLLLGHPQIAVSACTSRQYAKRRVDSVHPQLRSLTDLAFIDDSDLADYDVLLLATPHGTNLDQRFADKAPLVVDLSADFRLRDAAAYEQYYGQPHPRPDALAAYVTGLPELYRSQLAGADRISTPGCMATAAILALHPLASAGLLAATPVDVDARTGSSGSGAGDGPASLHAERSGAMRVFAPIGHRHEAEIAQATGLPVRMTATGVEAVRGVQVLCRADLADGIDPIDVRRAYRQYYQYEPFVRIIAHSRGIYRLPEPKILAGSNFCDVGFAVDAPRRRVLAVAALDNLVKGGAGNAVQSLNIRFGWPERTGLGFPGLHPI